MHGPSPRHKRPQGSGSKHRIQQQQQNPGPASAEMRQKINLDVLFKKEKSDKESPLQEPLVHPQSAKTTNDEFTKLMNSLEISATSGQQPVVPPPQTKVIITLW